jgi:hypothetical protein
MEPNAGNAGLFEEQPLAAAGGAAPPAAPNTGGSPVVFPTNWKDALAPEYRDAGFMKNIADIPSLVKSYASAQTMIGADKIAIPGANATGDDWKQVFQKLGVPEKAEDYKVDLDKTWDGKVDKDFLDKFKATAHGANILPSQAKTMAEWFAKENETAFKSMQAEMQQSVQAGLDALQKEWGAAYNDKIAATKAVMKVYGDEEDVKYIRESGLGKDARFIKFLNKLSSTISEDKIRGEGGSGGSMLSPQEAQKQIDAIKGDVKGPYWNKLDPKHVETKEKVNQLYAMRFPPPKAV